MALYQRLKSGVKVKQLLRYLNLYKKNTLLSLRAGEEDTRDIANSLVIKLLEWDQLVRIACLIVMSIFNMYSY